MYYNRLRMYTSQRGLDCSLTNFTDVQERNGRFVFERGLYSVPVSDLNKIFEHTVSSDVDFIGISLYFETETLPDSADVSAKVKEMREYVVNVINERMKKLALVSEKSRRIFPSSSHYNDYSFTEVSNEIFENTKVSH